MNIQILARKNATIQRRPSVFQGARHQIPIHRHEGKRHEQGRVYFRCAGERRPGEHGQLGGERSGYAGSHPVHCGGGQAGKGAGNPSVIRTPIVRNGKQSTIGYQPEVWKGWN